MKNCLMYKLAYYRFGEVRTKRDQPSGYDTVRNCEIGRKDIDLTYFREAYTSERWIVRIYEVLPLTNRVKKMDTRMEKGRDPPTLKEGKNSGQDVLDTMPRV